MKDFDIDWRLSSSAPVLSRKDVHIWRASLAQSAELIHKLTAILSADELIRAERFHFARDRKRFIVAWGGYCVLFSAITWKSSHSTLKFSYGERGKPSLAEPLDIKAIQFKLAHSQDLALYGFTLDRLIGVDLEKIRPVKDMAQIAQRLFSPHESETLETVPEIRKIEAFYQYWTGKEAYIKALGEGLGFPLDQVEVSLAPSEPTQLLQVGDDPAVAARWSLKSLIPSANFTATVAVEGIDLRFTFWQWSN